MKHLTAFEAHVSKELEDLFAREVKFSYNKYYITSKNFTIAESGLEIPKNTILRTFSKEEKENYLDIFTEESAVMFWVDKKREVYIEISESDGECVAKIRYPHPDDNTLDEEYSLYNKKYEKFRTCYGLLKQFIQDVGLTKLLSNKLEKTAEDTGILDESSTDQITLNPNLQSYYDVIKLLPEYFKNLRIVGDDKSWRKNNLTSTTFYFETVYTVTFEENDRHVGQHWQFSVSLSDDDFEEIYCENTGDGEPIENIDEMFNYIGGDRKMEFWKTLLQKDEMYRVECPAAVLKKLNQFPQIKSLKDLGVLESSKKEIDKLTPIMLKYYKFLKAANFNIANISYGKSNSLLKICETICYYPGRYVAFFNLKDDDKYYIKHTIGEVKAYREGYENSFSKYIFTCDDLLEYYFADKREKIWKIVLENDATFIKDCPDDVLTESVIDSSELNPQMLKFYNFLKDLGFNVNPKIKTNDSSFFITQTIYFNDSDGTSKFDKGNNEYELVYDTELSDNYVIWDKHFKSVIKPKLLNIKNIGIFAKIKINIFWRLSYTIR